MVRKFFTVCRKRKKSGLVTLEVASLPGKSGFPGKWLRQMPGLAY